MDTGPIIIVEDDEEDMEILEEVIRELKMPNKIVWFLNCMEAFTFIKTTEKQPFIIICDINLPGQSGIDFKKQIDADPFLREKSIPFIFYSTSANRQYVTEAYTKMTVQGYFQKLNSYEEIKKLFKLIFEYWKVCKHPNSKN
jgi:CheY-like chemotaxis protein